ncbi:MAG: type II toxin-antitoxin system VapC family toxin [Methanobacteriota archaeon]
MNNLANIPYGTKIIIDTNILVYFALAHEKYGISCMKFLSRVQNGEISGFIPTIVLNELVHILMMAELIRKGYGKNRVEAIQFMKTRLRSRGKKNHQSNESPNGSCADSFNTIVSTTWTWIEKISDLNCMIILERPSTFQASIHLSQEYGLLAKDAYIAAFAESYEISHIATNDIDFNAIPGLTSWIPETS